MEFINSFSKGLYQTSYLQSQPESTYIDATNWVKNDDNQLFNEYLPQIIATVEKDLLGGYVLNEELICLFQDEIGVFTIQNDYTTIYQNSDLNIQPNVDIEARIGFNNHRIVYFVDGVNPDRFIDLDNTSIINDLTDLNLNLTIKIPLVSPITITDTGNLPTGVYYIIARYATSVDNKTAFGIPSNPIFIVDEGLNSTRDNYDGADPQTNSSKAINFKISNRDTNYPYIEPIVVTYVGTTNQLVAYSLGIRDNTDSIITYSNISQNQDFVDLNEILLNPTFYETSKHIAQKDNILVRSNLTSRAKDLAFQDIANSILVEITTGSFPVTNTVTVNNPASQAGSDILVQDTYQSGVLEGYRNQSIILNNKSFQRGEVYSLAITPIYKDGSLGFAYHIPAKNLPSPYTQVYTSSEDYPSNQGYPEGKIKHHKIPDELESAGAYKIVTSNSIIPIYLKLTNIVIPDEIKSQIQGYIIGYQKRDSSLNRRIVAKGLLRAYNTLVGGNTDYGTSNVTFKISPFQGSTKIVMDEGTPWFPASAPYYNFLSPDYLHGYSINGNKLRVTHASKAESYLTYKKDIRMGIFLNEDISSRSPFISEDPALSSTVNINKLVEIAQVPGNNLYTLASNSKTFEYSGTKGLIHLETSSTVFDIKDHTHDASGGDPATNTKAWYYFSGDGDVFYHPKKAAGIAQPNYNKAPLFYAEIINDIPNQYGRLEDAEYCPLLVNTNFAQQTLIIQGDTYIQKYGLTISEQFHDASEDSYYRFDSTINFWMESTNLLNFRHSSDNAVSYYPKYKILYNAEGANPLGLHNYDIDKPYASGYNKQYSVTNNLKPTFSKPTIFEPVTLFPNRSIYSEKSFEGEIADQMRVYLPNNFHDISKTKGEITDTFVYNNRFYHHTEYSLWLSFFNDRVETTTSDGTVYLGNGGVFQQPSIELFPLEGGYCGTTSKCGTNTPFGRIFIDNHHGKVFLLSESIEEISDNGMFNFFRNFIDANSIYKAVYDYSNKRYLLTLVGAESDEAIYNTISYYPKTKSWTAFHDFNPEHYFSSNKRTLAFYKKAFYNLENSEGIRKNASLTFVINPNPDIYKIFDNQEINNTANKNNNPFPLNQNYYFDKETFSTIQCWNDYQNTDKVPLVLATDFDTANTYTNHIVKFNKGAYNTELPLDLVINPYDNIFISDNLDKNKFPKQRLVSKYLVTKYEYENSNLILLNYIKTNYRKAVR